MDWLFSSGNKSATALIKTGPGRLGGIIVANDGANAITIDIYDNTTNSGTILIPQIVLPSSATIRSHQILFPIPIHFAKGCYVVVSVAGVGTCGYTVFYK